MLISCPPVTDLIAPRYYEIWNDGVRERFDEQWLAGGRFCGKSVYWARFLVANLCAKGNEMCHAVCFRKQQTDLKDSVYAEVSTAIREMGLEFLFEFGTSPLIIRRKDTGQCIFFNGLDKAAKHKSKKPPFGYVKWLVFEELDEFSGYEEIESVQISYQRGPRFLTICAFNPPRSSANWANAEAAKKVPTRKVYRTDYRDLICKGWISNKILHRIQAMKDSNYESYRHIYLGAITGTGGEIFTNVKDASFTDEQLAFFRERGSYGMDFGIVNDPTVLLGTYYDTDSDTLYIFDEWTHKHPFYDTIYKALQERGLDKRDIIADTAPAGWIQNINRLGARLHGCHKAPDWVEEGVAWLRSRTRILIDSYLCPLAWNEFIHYEMERYKDGSPKEKLPDRDNHTIDAARYAQELAIKASLAKRYTSLPKGMSRRRH